MRPCHARHGPSMSRSSASRSFPRRLDQHSGISAKWTESWLLAAIITRSWSAVRCSHGMVSAEQDACELLLDLPALCVLGASRNQMFVMKLDASIAVDTDDLETFGLAVRSGRSRPQPKPSTLHIHLSDSTSSSSTTFGESSPADARRSLSAIDRPAGATGRRLMVGRVCSPYDACVWSGHSGLWCVVGLGGCGRLVW
jgi:hypothetical protein